MLIDMDCQPSWHKTLEDLKHKLVTFIRNNIIKILRWREYGNNLMKTNRNKFLATLCYKSFVAQMKS